MDNRVRELRDRQKERDDHVARSYQELDDDYFAAEEDLSAVLGEFERLLDVANKGWVSYHAVHHASHGSFENCMAWTCKWARTILDSLTPQPADSPPFYEADEPVCTARDMFARKDDEGEQR